MFGDRNVIDFHVEGYSDPRELAAKDVVTFGTMLSAFAKARVKQTRGLESSPVSREFVVVVVSARSVGWVAI